MAGGFRGLVGATDEAITRERALLTKELASF